MKIEQKNLNKNKQQQKYIFFRLIQEMAILIFLQWDVKNAILYLIFKDLNCLKCMSDADKIQYIYNKQSQQMNNRWGKAIQPKGSLRSSGQNNINININFNAVKDKANVFAGKKIDNFIEISNEPKTNLSRPNVSLQTLKQKKKKSTNIKQDIVPEPELNRKKSKSKLIPDMVTPQKKVKQRQSGNSKSLGKKSTKKRSSKSFDNLKKFYGRNSPKDMYYEQEYQKDGLRYKDREQNLLISNDNSRSKSNQKSRSKSKSKQKSNKKLTKNNSKTKIPTNSTNTRVKNSSHNSKKVDEQDRQKNMTYFPPQQQIPKIKKPSIKKNEKAFQAHVVTTGNTNTNSAYLKINQNQGMNKKTSTQRMTRKKLSQDQTKKIQRAKTPKKKSKQKQSKSLKRLPLYNQNSSEQQDSRQKRQQYNQQISYTKMQRQAYRLLYDEQSNKNMLMNKKTKKPYEQKQFQQNYRQNIYEDIQSIEQNHKKSRKILKNQYSCFQRYLNNEHNLKDMKFLTHHAIIIQKIWRGYRTRTQFINQINLMNHKIQITRNKIANLDPKFWDDAQSNSILKADDAQSEKNSQIVSGSRSNSMNSQLQKQITQKSFEQKPSSSKSRNSHNRTKQARIVERPLVSQQNQHQNDHKQMLEKILKLQQYLKKQQEKAQQLEQQNKELKVNLERVNIQNIFNSNYSNNLHNNGNTSNNNSNGNSQTNLQSIESSVKSDEQSWQQVKITNHGSKFKQDPFLQQDSKKPTKKQQKQQFELRLPKKLPNIQIKQHKQKQNKKQINNKNNLQLQKSSEYEYQQLSVEGSLSQSNQFSHKNNYNLKKYKNKIQANNNIYECSSPKYAKVNNNSITNKIEINTNLLELFNKKQDKLKQTYEKKISLYDRMLNDSIFSPRTYTFKKNQLQQTFIRETQVIRCRREEATRVAEYIKQIQQQNPKLVEPLKSRPQPLKKQPEVSPKSKQIHPTSIIKQSNHIIQDYGNINLNSHRSKDHQLSNEQPSQVQGEQQFQQSIQSNKSKDILQNIYRNKGIVNNSSISVSNSASNSNVSNASMQQNINLFNPNNTNIQIGNTNSLSLSKQIQVKNNQVIRIFQQVSQYHKKQQQDLSKSINYTQNKQPKQQRQQKQYKNKNQISNQSEQSIQEQQVKIQKKPYRGLQTTLLFIKQYCVSFIQYIRNSQIHRESFIDGITTPIQYDTFQLLRSYRTTLTSENQTSYNSHEKQYTYPYFKSLYPRNQVINRQAFNDFNQIYEKLQGECFFVVQRQFFLNSLLDAFNQALDYRRPCSIYGQPPSWISQSKTLKNHYLTNQDIIRYRHHFLGSEKFDQICGVAIAKVIEWSQSLCGFIPESPEMQNIVIEQQQINHIRQTRIALMLEKDLLQNEQNMLDFVIEQSEVKLQLGQMMLAELITEFMSEYQKYFNEQR